MSCADVNSSYINESAELTGGALYLIHYSEVAAHMIPFVFTPLCIKGQFELSKIFIIFEKIGMFSFDFSFWVYAMPCDCIPPNKKYNLYTFVRCWYLVFIAWNMYLFYPPSPRGRRGETVYVHICIHSQIPMIYGARNRIVKFTKAKKRETLCVWERLGIQRYPFLHLFTKIFL